MFRLVSAILIGLAFLSAPGCQLSQTQAQPAASRSQSDDDRAVAVETATAKLGALNLPLQYTGTTAPGKLVSLRSQAEGRLLNLRVDVGDRVAQGQTIVELDDRLPTIAINQARAELASLQSEVDRTRAEVSDAQAQVVQAEVALKQAQSDAVRLQSLADSGAISQQQAEQAQSAVASAAQVLRSAQEQVRTRQKSIQAAEGRVAAQYAALSEEKARRSYTSLNAPISGVVTERLTEPGNLVQPGNEILKIGDFSTLKIAVPVSELDLAKIQVGQTVKVKFDAFPQLDLQGRVNRISPTADATARLIPVEVTVPNMGDRITGGLLARVEFNNPRGQRIVIPQSALEPAGGKSPQNRARTASGPPKSDQSDHPDHSIARVGKIYVVEQTGDQSKVTIRPVKLGGERNGQVEVLSGLKSGERYVVRSDQPLEVGQSVRQSILSES
jgi:multidrug efflux pump subunit AcrA (membrane-fusion protein)